MAQWLRLVDLLHPDGRPVSEWIDRIVVGHRGITKHGTPETDVEGIVFRRDGHLHFLDGCTIGDRTLPPHHGRNGARELDVPRLEIPEVAAQADGHTSIREGE